MLKQVTHDGSSNSLPDGSRSPENSFLGHQSLVSGSFWEKNKTSETSKIPPTPLIEGGIVGNGFKPFPTEPIFHWSDYEPPFPQVEKIIPASKLPDDIASIPDDILNWAIECEVTGKPFRIIKQELEFYRKHHIPIPRKHPDQRHLERMQQRNPRKLFHRKCDQCQKPIQTTYSPERKERVYCESCYEKEMY